MGEVVTSIAALEGKGGLPKDGWELQLLRAADAAGDDDGKTSLAELDAYLANPRDGRFVSAAALQQMRAELAVPGRAGVQTRAVSSFSQEWQRQLAERADAHGNRDGALAETELDEEVARGLGGARGATRRISDQGIAALRSRVAASTGEADLLRIADRNGGPPSGIDLVRRYARTVYDPQRRLPAVVGYVLSAADLQAASIERDGQFRGDTDIRKQARAYPADYENQGFDIGHMRPATDSATQEAMTESFLMSNGAPQTPNLNRQVWKQLETAVHEAVRVTGGRATVFSGTLFLDAHGAPLPANRVRWLSREIRGIKTDRVAVPTHFFKAVLFERPDGKMTMVGFVVPNRDDLPTEIDAMQPLMRGARRSIRDIERLAGVDLFRDLPADIQDPMESSPDACMALPSGTRFHAVSLLWPDDCRPQSWTMPRDQQAAPPAAKAPAENGFVRWLRSWF